MSNNMQATDNGPNPYYEGRFEAESIELADLRRRLVAERDAALSAMQEAPASQPLVAKLLDAANDFSKCVSTSGDLDEAGFRDVGYNHGGLFIEAARALKAAQSVNVAAQEHGRMPSASGSTGVGQTDDGALTSGPGMRARNAEGSPPAAATPIPLEPVAWMKRVAISAEWDALDFSANAQTGFDVPLYAAPISAQPTSADAVDAARYRFIRDADRSDERISYLELLMYAGDSLDKAVDAVMGEPK